MSRVPGSPRRARSVTARAVTARTLLGRLARDRATLAVAESCTGGLLGATLTAVPGASRVFLGGIIAYADGAKVGGLGVDDRVLRGAGSVSAAAVEAMAHGARDRFGASLGVAVSGIAGPGGGTVGKPVGTVWLAALGPGDLLHVHRLQASGGRSAVRRAAVREAMRLLWGNLLEAERERIVG